MPLGEGVLGVNLGIPIIVVVNKVDLMLHGEKVAMLEKNIEFIWKHLRQYNLTYAASMMFISTTSHINIENLYRYIMHRLYDFEFKIKPQLHEKEALFIPTGFDSMNLISELCKNAQDNIVFEDVLKKPQ